MRQARLLLDLARLRFAKIAFSVFHPKCWAGLVHGVAPSIEHRAMLRGLTTDLVLDVGANRGQFTLMVRLIHPKVRIQAYEPLPDAAKLYLSIHGGRKEISLHQLALGDQAGSAELHVSGQADSSSLLPIGDLQRQFYPSTQEIGTQQVKVATLDSLPHHWQAAQRALLKLDVQGFELNVLRGSVIALKHCAYVYAECSEVPLYTGQALYPEIATFLAGEGFALTLRANEQWVDGRLVQADYLFSRAN